MTCAPRDEIRSFETGEVRTPLCTMSLSSVLRADSAGTLSVSFVC